MKLLGTETEDLKQAAEALATGKLVAFPTETVYGLGADALNTSALARVFQAKRRPAFDPLIVHIASQEMLEQLVDFSALGPQGQRFLDVLSKELWPGPLTLVLPKKAVVPDLATSGLTTVAIRMPAHPVARTLIEMAQCPIAAPSANPFGYLSPTRAEHVKDQLGDEVDLIIDGGPCPVGVESTVLDLSSEKALILRPGGLSRSRIEACIGPVDQIDRTQAQPSAPGQLASHYAPRTPLYLYPRHALGDEAPRKGEAFLFYDAASKDCWLERFPEAYAAAAMVLSEQGDSAEAAARLFAVLHDLDTRHFLCIRAERAPDEDLGPAINDRLYKARFQG